MFCNFLKMNWITQFLFNMKKLFPIFFVLIVLFETGCHNTVKPTSKLTVKPLTQKELITFNRKLVRQEKREIDAFIKMHHWKMKETGTGLRYHIFNKGKGPKAQTGQMATIQYSVQLFNGQTIYSGIKSFRIGYGEAERGLQEGILLLKSGEIARFILPSHLAYGLSGDGNKIPPHTPIIYHVKLLNLK